MFSKCCEKAKMKLCMHQDIKNKVESNFGPMEDILQETQLTEHEFFPLVMQLLHGKEITQRWTDLAWGRLAPVLSLQSDPCNYQPSSMLATISNSARFKSILTKTKLKLRHLNMFKGLK